MISFSMTSLVSFILWYVYCWMRTFALGSNSICLLGARPVIWTRTRNLSFQLALLLWGKHVRQCLGITLDCVQRSLLKGKRTIQDDRNRTQVGHMQGKWLCILLLLWPLQLALDLFNDAGVNFLRSVLGDHSQQCSWRPNGTLVAYMPSALSPALCLLLSDDVTPKELVLKDHLLWLHFVQACLFC